MNVSGANRATPNATPLPKTPPEIGGSTVRPTVSNSVRRDDDDPFVTVKLETGQNYPVACDDGEDGEDGDDGEEYSRNDATNEDRDEEEEETEEEDETEKGDTSIDYFHYPKPTDYSFIVANDIVPLATPDKWRHSMSAIFNRGGNLLRVTIVGCEFPGRCFDCKLNNKSVCFCFFGQNTRDGDHGVELTPDLRQRLQRIECFSTSNSVEENFYAVREGQGSARGDALTQEWFALDDDKRAKFAPDVRPEPIEHFPDPDIIFKVKSIKRLSKQHYLPPVVNLLCQAPFTKYFDEHTFDGFLRRQAHISIGIPKSMGWKWREPVSNVTNRITVLKGVKKLPRAVDRRLRISQVMSGLYGQWTSAKAGEKCTPHCRSGGCVHCRKVRAALKREYKEQVRKVIDNRIYELFMASKGPFQLFSHRTFNGEFYEDHSCRVVRIHVEQ